MRLAFLSLPAEGCTHFAGRQLPFGRRPPTLRHDQSLVSIIASVRLPEIQLRPTTWCFGVDEVQAAA